MSRFLLPFWAWGITFRLPLNQPHVIVVERLFNTFATTLKLWGIFYIYGSACFWDFCTAAYVGMVLGVILFHAQHSFEEGYCARKSSWSFSDAAFRGSSCIRVPWFLRWFTMGAQLRAQGVAIFFFSICSLTWQRAQCAS
eukprot:SAG31_NODE_2065_length_6530_cov_22.048515_2_plen_140_part_00